jgi:uncharacterized membrane protein
MHPSHASERRIGQRPGTWTLFALLLACRQAAESPLAPSYAEARAVVEGHCVSCHSEHPTIPAFPIAPGGVLLDTSTQMQQYAERIRVRTALDRTMPLLNKTGMTEDERNLLAGWVENGAQAPE